MEWEITRKERWPFGYEKGMKERGMEGGREGGRGRGRERERERKC